ncbi:hypothetical protein HY546_01475 [archaeon]|nr:hypothetical protein [archaeon]
MFCRHPQCWAIKGIVVFLVGAAWLADSLGTRVLGWQWYSYLGLLVLLHGLMIAAAGATGHGFEGTGKKK